MTYRSPAEQATLDRLLAVDVGTGVVERYGEDPDQLWEWWGEPGAPVVVLVHGGYFRPAVDRTHARPMAVALAADGYRVALAEYRRVPGHPDPSIADLAALAGALAAAGVEPVAWVGHSAGGTLVMLRALVEGRGTPVIALAPVLDLSRNAADGLGDGAVVEWLGGLPGEAEADGLYDRVDPARLLARQGWPLPADLGVTILVPMDDATVPPGHCTDLGVPYLQVPDAHHFDLVDPRSPHFGTVLAAIRGLG